MTPDELRDEIESLFELGAGELPNSATGTFAAFRDALGNGTVRAASPGPDGWQTNAWVKKGILVGFRLGRSERTADAGPLGFVDKHTLPARRFDDDEGVRVVPGGSSIREGAYIGRDVICMPPMYVNIGAYVDDGTLIDSHALVGSCAQIGKRVHISAAAQIGGVSKRCLKCSLPMTPKVGGLTGLLCAGIAATRPSILLLSSATLCRRADKGSRPRPVASSTFFCFAVPVRPLNSEMNSRTVRIRPWS